MGNKGDKNISATQISSLFASDRNETADNNDLVVA